VDLLISEGPVNTGERTGADRCWVDARVHCPYGNPEGQYISRPETFCNAQCQTFAGLVAARDPFRKRALELAADMLAQLSEQ